MDQPTPRAVADGIPVHCAFDHLADPAALVENPRNPNVHPPAQVEMLARIIKHQGWRAPITVSKRSGFIVRGHGRLHAALLLHLGQVPVEDQEYATEADEWADLIADNRIAELAELDYRQVADLLRDMDGAIDLALTGFRDFEIEPLLAAVWTPPDGGDGGDGDGGGGGDGGDHDGQGAGAPPALAIALSAPQRDTWVVARQAAVDAKLAAVTAEDGAVLAAICQAFLDAVDDGTE